LRERKEVPGKSILINLFFGVISFSQQTTHAKGLTLKTILKKNKERLDMSTAVVYNVVDGCRQE